MICVYESSPSQVESEALPKSIPSQVENKVIPVSCLAISSHSNALFCFFLNMFLIEIKLYYFPPSLSSLQPPPTYLSLTLSVSPTLKLTNTFILLMPTKDDNGTAGGRGIWVFMKCLSQCFRTGSSSQCHLLALQGSKDIFIFLCHCKTISVRSKNVICQNDYLHKLD